MALGKVYSFGPTFRAEKSKTRRHLTEFWMVEPEVAYATLDDLMQLGEGSLSTSFTRVLEARVPSSRSSGATSRSSKKLRGPFPRITYDEAVKMLNEGHEKGRSKTNSSGAATSDLLTKLHLSAVRPAGDDPPLSRRGEGVLHGARPGAARTWRYASMSSRPKATARLSAAPSAWQSYELLLERIHEHELPEEAFKWYLDLRKYGGCRTPGSAWASSAPWLGFAGWSTSAKPFHSRACCTGFIP